MLYSMVLAWAALVTSSMVGGPASAASAATESGRVVIFRCSVRDVMTVTQCKPREDAQLGPGEAPGMIAAIEQSRCATVFAPGLVVERGIEPPQPGELATAYHVISFPDWVAGGEKAREFYPPLAAHARQTGSVTHDCDVLASGAVDNCMVIAEAPSGQGFGEAALKASTYFRFLPKTVDCQPVEGGKIRIPVNFRFH